MGPFCSQRFKYPRHKTNLWKRYKITSNSKNIRSSMNNTYKTGHYLKLLVYWITVQTTKTSDSLSRVGLVKIIDKSKPTIDLWPMNYKAEIWWQFNCPILQIWVYSVSRHIVLCFLFFNTICINNCAEKYGQEYFLATHKNYKEKNKKQIIKNTQGMNNAPAL